MNYVPVIGLEIHAELLTKSKLFCSCAAEFGGERNSRCCPGCAAMPGTLPVMNRAAVEYAVLAGFALDCSINKFSVFDRKNYFYPDLPKAYQNSQLALPLCINGLVAIEYESDGVKKSKDIRINRIHLEEDAGKLIHDDLNGVSLADYNRGAIPLIEIVTEPDIGSAEEAKAFVEKIILTLQYAGVCDCKMEQGSLRCDVNISIMKPTDTKLGTRAEIKNLNSIKSIGRAIEHEIYRQSKLLDAGKRVVQETRRFDDNKGETKSMRSKENLDDYRYFPDPDILQVNFTDEDLAEIKSRLPEMPYARLDRYINKFGLSEVEAKIIVNQKRLSDFYEDALRAYHNPKSVCNFITGELMRRINLGEINLEKLPFTASALAKLAEMADNEAVSKNDAKAIFRIMSDEGGAPEEIAKAKGLLITNDTGKVAEVIERVIADNEKAVLQYQGGDMKVFGFLMGQCSKELKGVCTPKVIKEELEKKLKGA
ncbi:MAG: Asp-tRNA(Asn)/Glu-tRNA(Gln) amidotransferase subunit GatB [Oscillospiraceae bacterium]|nr:Asp-tRNA(Asn)/Glu-tRNA(Gln) amidotransferase subunit GatB [Oscillospiraceae bacterium]